jgi:hypothetical protein
MFMRGDTVMKIADVEVVTDRPGRIEHADRSAPVVVSADPHARCHREEPHHARAVRPHLERRA